MKEWKTTSIRLKSPLHGQCEENTTRSLNKLLGNDEKDVKKDKLIDTIITRKQNITSDRFSATYYKFYTYFCFV